MPITEPLGERYIVPADAMPLKLQWQQLERALDHICSDDPERNAGIPPALAYIDAMQERLEWVRKMLISMQGRTEP